MYTIWKPENQSASAFREGLTGELATKIDELGALGYRVCVYDDDVANTTSAKLENSKPHPDGMLSLWLHSANDYYRAPFEQEIAAFVAQLHGYLVTESEPTPNTRFPVASLGERTHGMCQIAMLTVPDRITHADWLALWRNSHTFVGIGTQATFGYRQNSIVRALTYAAPTYAGFIEESFPEAAMRSKEYYFDDHGEKAEQWDSLVEQFFPAAKAIRANHKQAPRWQVNAMIMQASCARFINTGQDPSYRMSIDCMPYSEYVMK